MNLVFGCLVLSGKIFASPCTYGILNSCPKDFQCIKLDDTRAECLRTTEPGKNVFLPFKRGVRVFCDQGNLSAEGKSHTFQNTAFAMDLSSDPSGDKGAEIVAVTEGVAVVYDKCAENNSNCGAGFGNHVKVFSDNGTVAMYAHLKKVFLKSGEKVVVDTMIGLEGQTGLAGDGNTHLHFSLHFDWRPLGLKFWKKVGYLPPSVPFFLTYCREKEAGISACRTCRSTELVCRRKSATKSVIFREL